MEPVWAGVAVAAGAVVGALVWQYAVGWVRSRALRRRFRHGAAGENLAGKWLVDHGFRIVAAHPECRCRMDIDKRTVSYTVRVDFLVQKRGRRAVVEVKTGAAVKPFARVTRRQLYEYAGVYAVDDLYLFDADAKRLHRVKFPGRPVSFPLRRALIWFCAGIITGSICTVLGMNYW